MLEPAFSGILPHPPIVVPDVGGDALAQCESTERGCREFARRLAASRPSRLLLVSPHSPSRRDAFGVWGGRRLRGDLDQFAAPCAGIDLPRDAEWTEGIRAAAAGAGVRTWSIPAGPLDHGAVVPLWFLAQAGWSGPTCIVSLPARATPERLTAFGRACARAAEALPGRPAFVASGDMTHRAEHGAPCGYHPRALEFDRALTSLVGTGRLAGIGELDPELRSVAAEDAADSSLVVAAALDFEARGAEVLSYEHPFGVGYLVAVFHRGGGA